MRRLLGATVAVALAWAGSASAQSALTWGPPPGPIQYRVVKTAGSKIPTAMPAAGQSKSSIAGFFTKLNPFAKKSAAPAPSLPRQAPASGKNSLGMTGFGQ